MSIEEAANQSQNGQRDEVSQAGRDGRGNVVWVDPKFPSTNHYADHQCSCREGRVRPEALERLTGPRPWHGRGNPKWSEAARYLAVSTPQATQLTQRFPATLEAEKFGS